MINNNPVHNFPCLEFKYYVIAKTSSEYKSRYRYKTSMPVGRLVSLLSSASGPDADNKAFQPQSVLVIGASRGLGLALVKYYSSVIHPSNVFATVRGSAPSATFPKGVRVIESVDCSKEDCGQKVVDGLQGAAVDLVAYVAGVLKPEAGRFYFESVSTLLTVDLITVD